VRYTLLSSTLHLFPRRSGADISSLCLEHPSTPFIYHCRGDGKPATPSTADEGNSEAAKTITNLLVRSREEELRYRSSIYLATGERVRGGGPARTYAYDDDEMADLEELFARLKAAGSAQPTSDRLPVEHTMPSLWGGGGSSSSPKPNQAAAAPLWSPSQTAVGMVAEQQQQQQQQRTSHLLGLLRFNSDQGVRGVNEKEQDQKNGGAGRSTSFTSSSSSPAAGGLTQSQGDWTAAGRQQQKSEFLATIGAEKATNVGGSVGSAQADLLLNLLRKPTPTTTTTATTTTGIKEQKPTTVEQLVQNFAEKTMHPLPQPKREGTPARQFGSAASRESTPFEAPPQASKASRFTYANPFDQLHASSPLNRGTPAPKDEEESGKHGREGRDGDGGPAAKSRKVEEEESTPTVKAESVSPPNMEPEISTTTPSQPEASKESVSDVLEGVGERVEKEVAEALEEAEKAAKNGREAGTRNNGKEALTEKEGAVKKDAPDADSSWESAEESPQEKTAEVRVKVYNFPMKPFVAIDIKPDHVPDNAVRMEHVMSIASLKKDFEQMDRNLITASTGHIVYAQTATKKEHAGMRVIRQDTGEHAQVFRGSGERVFHVQLCHTPDADAVLGTGVRGSVFWARLPRAGRLDGADAEAAGFILPAVPTAEEAAGQAAAVRTRAKCSTRHPGMLALGRGRTIHLVAPATAATPPYCNPATRRVDTARYFAEHGLRIATGKAGKDFTFAEDDSVIVSLDKHGAVKFWDVRELAARAADSAAEGPHAPVELSRPLWTLHAAAAADDKGASSVTSVMLLDKDRPHHKGQALRYMLLGFRQNHVLQLWDLGLAKPVQEVRLPHTRDSDAICSLAYHPKTGILAVGHPTRNSVYFLHLSAPKYNLPAGMDQARFINLLARADPALPRPESTAIVSGLREFVFTPAGAGLRSLDMLRTPMENGGPAGAADETLFELYVMHARGAFVWGVKRADLGWDGQGKMVEPVDALEAGVVQVSELRIPAPKPTSSAVGSEASSQATVTAERRRENKKQDGTKQLTGSASKTGGEASVKRGQGASPAPATNGAQKVDAKPDRPSKQIPEASTPSQHQPQQSAATNPPLITPNSYTMPARRAKSPAKETSEQNTAEPSAEKKAFTSAAPTPAAAASSSILPLDQSIDFPGLLTRHLDTLYQRLDSDKRVAAAASAAQQDAILRLVSSTLTENVEQTLQRIVAESVTRDVLPALAARVNAQLAAAVRHELRDPDVLQRAVAEALRPEMESRMRAMEEREGTKADLCTDMLRTVSETLQSLVRAQTEMHERIRALEGQIKEMGAAAAAAAAAAVAAQKEEEKEQEEEEGDEASMRSAPLTAEEQEVQQITNMLVNGDYEGATIQVCFAAF